MLRVGTTRIDITPPPGLPLMGYPDIRTVQGAPTFHRREAGYTPRQGHALGTLDPLYGKVLVLDQGAHRIALVSLDLCVVDDALTRRVREIVSQLSDIKPTSVALLASHTHSGPDLGGYWDPVNPAHQYRVAVQIAEAIVTAETNLEQATLSVAEGDIGDYVINRINPDGPIDPAAGVLVARGQDRRVRAVVVNIAAHALVLPPANVFYSADWPGGLMATLEAAYPGANVLFLNGSAGNINPVGFPLAPKEDIVKQHRRLMIDGGSGVRGPEHSNRLGRLMAASVIRAIEAAPDAGSDGSVAHASANVELPLRDRSGRERFCSYMNVQDDYLQMLLAMDHFDAEVQAFRIGPATLVTLPGEPFVEIGLSIKELGGSSTLVAGYANSDPRYIPTDEALAATTYETFGTPLAAGAASRLVTAAKSCLELLP